MGILEKNIILGSANASPTMIFFKDPIYFRITPLSVYITNNVSEAWNYVSIIFWECEVLCSEYWIYRYSRSVWILFHSKNIFDQHLEHVQCTHGSIVLINMRSTVIIKIQNSYISQMKDMMLLEIHTLFLIIFWRSIYAVMFFKF